MLRRAYDPTLQRLWADWAVSEVDGQWLLIEVRFTGDVLFCLESELHAHEHVYQILYTDTVDIGGLFFPNPRVCRNARPSGIIYI